MKKIPLLVILGPTASGKSDLAVKIAKMIARKHVGGFKGAEIISADSRQIYRGMDIGTGKITKKEMRGIPHHLLDVADPRMRFTVVEFKKRAEEAIRDIVSRGKLPIICGGTGFYIDALINDTEFETVQADEGLRTKLANKTASQLFNILKKKDPERAVRMNESDNKNPRRLIRAIEIASAGRSCQMSFSREDYTPILVGLKVQTELLRERIHKRLLKRIRSGMIDEARNLHRPIRQGGAGLSWKRMEELGLEYRYMALHLQGKMTQKEMIEQLETEIRHYAKRQMTWFKRNKKIKWFEPNQFKAIEQFIRNNKTKVLTVKFSFEMQFM